MLDWSSRLLLAVTAGVLAFAVTLLASSGVADGLLGAPSPVAVGTPTEKDADESGVLGLGDIVAVERPAAPPLTIAFVGDIHGEAPISDVLADGENPLAAMEEVLSSADLTVANLETPMGTGGTRDPDKTFVFQADPALATALVDVGVDVVSLANNHALDYGVEGARETVEVATAAGLTVVGYGEDADAAFAPHLVEVDGRTVAVVGLTRVMPLLSWGAGSSRPGMASAYDIDVAAEAVRDAAELADHVVVTIHWGRERHVCAHGEQRALVSALSAAGADVIAGHHPHVLQGVDTVGDTLVAYSLGNFVFYARTPATRQSGVLTVTLGSGTPQHTWTPAEIDDSGRPVPVPSQPPIRGGEDLTVTGSGPDCGPPGTDPGTLAPIGVPDDVATEDVETASTR